MDLPGALLVDLDDTILDSDSNADEVWLGVCRELAGRLGSVAAQELHVAVMDSRDWLWSDFERARPSRLDLWQARRDILTRSLASLRISNTPIVESMAERYATIREEELRPFPGAIDTLRRLKSVGIHLGLLTNGGSESQRGKIDKYGLAEFFDHIQIEGEFGIGKLDERAFRNALNALGVDPTEAWVIGDNLDFDTHAAQQIGIYAVWVNSHRNGLPDGTTVRPDWIVGSISELVNDGTD
ncbi:MAG: HAD family hydrolase [Chloroflexi bacterium]|nr:HAD family hydrolase [Chloroflexota bacterium]